MEFLDNNQNNLQNLEDQDFEQLTVVTQVTDANEVLENNNHVYRSKIKWTTDKKIELLEIEQEERNKGRQFMERVRKRWNEIYPASGLTRQNLRDNAARFKKDKKLANLRLVRKRQNLDRSVEIETSELINEETRESRVQQNTGEQFTEEWWDELDVQETDRDLYTKFVQHLQEIKKVEQNNFEGRPKLTKVKNLGENESKANRILEKYLQKYQEMSHIVNAVYAMGLAVVDMLGVKKVKVKPSEDNQGKSNRKEREKEHQIEAMDCKS